MRRDADYQKPHSFVKSRPGSPVCLCGKVDGDPIHLLSLFESESASDQLDLFEGAKHEDPG